MTPWVTRLIVANLLVFFVVQSGTFLYALMTLFPAAVVGLDEIYIPGIPLRPWTLLTYMFLHAGPAHVFWNMLMLFFFGRRVETRLGGKAFLWLYFLSGVGGAAFSFVFSFGSPVVGASAAVYGVVIAFAMFWPEPVYIWGVLPIPARWLAVAFVAVGLYSGTTGDGTAHFAHLGGLAVGAGFLRWRDRRLGKKHQDFRSKVDHTPSMEGSQRIARARWASINLAAIHDLNRNEVEELLARVDRGELDSLSLSERQFLDRMAGG
jgi:membrane associated rhomboid family serine protease